MGQPELAQYRRKRDFSKTNEPSGEARLVPSEALRFVIQKHAASHLHFDLRLEYHETFKSWAVPKGPSPDPDDQRLAMQVEDRPLESGDFEGTIPKGQYGGARSCCGTAASGRPRRVPRRSVRRLRRES